MVQKIIKRKIALKTKIQLKTNGKKLVGRISQTTLLHDATETAVSAHNFYSSLCNGFLFFFYEKRAPSLNTSIAFKYILSRKLWI